MRECATVDVATGRATRATRATRRRTILGGIAAGTLTPLLAACGASSGAPGDASAGSSRLPTEAQ